MAPRMAKHPMDSPKYILATESCDMFGLERMAKGEGRKLGSSSVSRSFKCQLIYGGSYSPLQKQSILRKCDKIQNQIGLFAI